MGSDHSARFEPTGPVVAPALRLRGVDVARAVALIGMVTVHVGPDRPVGSDLTSWIYFSFFGKASALFVLVAGVGVALMGRDDLLVRTRQRLVYRAVWLVPLGLWLQTLDHPVAVILQYYGAYFLLAALFVGVTPRAALLWAAAFTIVGSAVWLGLSLTHPSWLGLLYGRRAEAPFGLPGELLVTGYYPAITWMPYLLVGFAIGRAHILDSTRPGARRIAAAGVAIVVASSWVSTWLQGLAGADLPRRLVWDIPWDATWGLSSSGHAQMPLSILAGTGFALAALGVCTIVARRFPGLTAPLAAMGQLSLSVYVIHLLVFHLAPDVMAVDDLQDGIRTVAGFAVVSAAASWMWLRVFERGPIEALVRWPWHAIVEPLLIEGPHPPQD